MASERIIPARNLSARMPLRPQSRPEETAAKPDLIERQLTANPGQNYVHWATISPNGTYLAYADMDDKLWLRAIESGDTLPIAVPEGW